MNEKAKKVLINALNRTLRKYKKSLTTELSDEYAINKKLFRKDSIIKSYRANNNALNIKIFASKNAKIGANDLKGTKLKELNNEFGIVSKTINSKINLEVLNIRKAKLNFTVKKIVNAPSFFGYKQKNGAKFLRKSSKNISEIITQKIDFNKLNEILRNELKD